MGESRGDRRLVRKWSKYLSLCWMEAELSIVPASRAKKVELPEKSSSPPPRRTMGLVGKITCRASKPIAPKGFSVYNRRLV